MVAAIDPAHGRVAADSPAALKQAGNEALKTDLARAAHMYTLGIDLCLKGADIDELTSADWYRLDGESNGALHALLANRSFAYLQQTDPAAAVVDAEYCCLARPEFAKGHMRLLAALEANGATASERRAACARGIRACPASAALKDEWSRLGEKGDPAQTETEAAAAEAEAGLALTRRVAADPEDPRRFMAAGDLGSALAVGAHGLSKDVVEAVLLPPAPLPLAPAASAQHPHGALACALSWCTRLTAPRLLRAAGALPASGRLRRRCRLPAPPGPPPARAGPAGRGG